MRIFHSVYMTFTVILAIGAIWMIWGRWNPSQMTGLEGIDLPNVSVRLDSTGSGTMTTSAAGTQEIIRVEFSKRAPGEIAPIYKLRILTRGTFLNEGDVFELMTDPRGPDVLICPQCGIGQDHLPSMWRISRS